MNFSPGPEKVFYLSYDPAMHCCFQFFGLQICCWHCTVWLRSHMYKYNPVFFQRKMTTNSIQSIELKQNYFEQLPDEVILKVLCLLPIQDLIQCATLSRRFKVICKDFSLWKTTIKLRSFGFLPAFRQTIIQQTQHSTAQ